MKICGGVMKNKNKKKKKNVVKESIEQESTKKVATKKKYWTIIISSCSLFLLGFVFLFIAAGIQSGGGNSTLYSIFGISFFPCCLIALIILLSNKSTLIEHEVKSKFDGVDECKYKKVTDISINQIINNLTKFKFKNELGYYHLSKFTFFKGTINYYIKIIDDINNDSLEDTLKAEIDKFNNLNINKKNKCLIIIIQKESICESLLESFTIGSKMMIMYDVALQPCSFYDASILLLYDKSNQTLYYVESSQFGFSVYKYGIKMLKKLLDIK